MIIICAEIVLYIRNMNAMKQLIACATLFIFLCISCGEKFPLMDGDMILMNGKVITVNDNFDVHEMLIIRHDTIAYSGEEIVVDTSRDIRIINLDGRTVMPGLIEPHTHPAASAGLYQWTDVSGFTHRTAEEALNALRDKVKVTPEGEWIFGFGWDAMLLEGAYPPYKEILDDISTKHPIWIMMQSMHSHYFNSLAFSMAGITRDVENAKQGGYYEKDEFGNLTGLVTEQATLAPFIKIIPAPKMEQLKYMIKAQYSMYHKNGITSIGVTGLIDAMMPNAEEIIHAASLEKNASLRVFLYRMGGRDYSQKSPLKENDFFQHLGYKYWADGSPYTGTMLLREAYEQSELNQSKLSIPQGSFGHEMLPLPIFKNLVHNDAKAQHQISIHAQGDSACVLALDVMEHALQEKTNTDHRFRLEHLALITKSQVNQMVDLGITPSFHINHIYYYGDFLAKIVGGKRANQFMPIGLMTAYDQPFSLHNDSPMYPPKPFLAAQTAVTRKTSNGRTLGAEYAISVEEAIRAITIYPAWQMFAEDLIGSLEVGKKADFIILTKNPLTIDPNNLSEINIEHVFVEGSQIF